MELRDRVDGAGWSCRLVLSDGGVLELRFWWAPYVAGGWRWGLPVANHPVSGLMSAARIDS